MEQGKAVRILDAAEALLVGFGYRKVTVDDVARRAGVGKGTVYLYWPSKKDLFATVLVRDSAALLAAELDVLRADPAEVQLHRALRRSFQETMRRPLTRALATGDHEALGELLTASKIGWQFTVGKVETTARYLAVLHRHGLLADDPVAEPILTYRVSAAVTGSFLLDGMPGAADFSVADKAAALAETVRRAFEPDTEPTPAMLRAAAAEMTELYQQWLTELADALPGESA
ncbi:TetR/AcrR family transcriptional regulator [Saccharopolyspora sp. K220]|uniref:TetR/AcrR family transcriptional regulator n=1 Tax=Saccharopolyspora soli TaxID=2926618 RepID=UPI001F5A602E|nr:TetR/AcrR family transcriptional regulator [Saccharopolyspora soli]MCI2417186.1 TetR/AcrR family transcriptional regulator [Saccharopolyspora soli]